MSTINLIEDYYKKERETLCNKIKRRMLSEGDEEDVVQEAFYRAIKFQASFLEDGNLAAWIGIILDNCAKEYRADFFRKSGSSFHNDSEEFDEENFAIDSTPMDNDWVAISQVIEEMELKSQKHKETLRLFFLFGYRPAEIKGLLKDVPLSTVKTNIQRFKEHLIKKYQVE